MEYNISEKERYEKKIGPEKIISIVLRWSNGEKKIPPARFIPHHTSYHSCLRIGFHFWHRFSLYSFSDGRLARADVINQSIKNYIFHRHRTGLYTYKIIIIHRYQSSRERQEWSVHMFSDTFYIILSERSNIVYHVYNKYRLKI